MRRVMHRTSAESGRTSGIHAVTQHNPGESQGDRVEQNTKMGRKNQGKAVKSGLGRGLVNKTVAKQRAPKSAAELRHTVEVAVTTSDSHKLSSITERNELDSFLINAVAEERKFTTTKRSAVVVLDDDVDEAATVRYQDAELFDYRRLPIPRRPVWDVDTTADELDALERSSFLEWRRGLAHTEELSKLQVTPFEKNLEVWRQLWRVVERSDVVCHIVDCRDPLLFMSRDLLDYVKEVDSNKKVLLLLNKADFLSPWQRCCWAGYFDAKGLQTVFFSATMAQEAQEAQKADTAGKNQFVEELGLNADIPPVLNPSQLLQVCRNLYEYGAADPSSTRTGRRLAEVWEVEAVGRDTVGTNGAGTARQETAGDHGVDRFNDVKFWAVPFASIEELSDLEDDSTDDKQVKATTSEPGDPLQQQQHFLDYKYWHSSHISEELPLLSDEEDEEEKEHEQKRGATADAPQMQRRQTRNDGRITIGMVGYPNVGKSSTLNVLLGDKRLATSATPGKTKHFQTHLLGEDIVLCDCPGLVFPTFLGSHADLLVSGILSANHMRDYRAPLRTLCARVSPAQLLDVYPRALSPQQVAALRAGGRRVLLKPQVGLSQSWAAGYARDRGFMKDHGNPDDSRAARVMLTDLLHGRLLYSKTPPGVSESARRQWVEETFHQFLHLRARARRIKEAKSQAAPLVGPMMSMDQVTRHLGTQTASNDTQDKLVAKEDLQRLLNGDDDSGMAVNSLLANPAAAEAASALDRAHGLAPEVVLTRKQKQAQMKRAPRKKRKAYKDKPQGAVGTHSASAVPAYARRGV